jgi:uncharacterized glyoxalase superfamily protein PhnB
LFAAASAEYLHLMLRNRSVPVDTVLPHISYKDLPRAIEWLSTTFGFVEHYHYGDPLSGAQMHLGNAWIMVNAAKSPEHRNPAELGYGTQSLTIFVEDVESHYARTRSAGANVVEELHETVYGEFQYGVRDPEGHLWLFSRHARDADPAAWGATVIHPK